MPAKSYVLPPTDITDLKKDLLLNDSLQIVNNEVYEKYTQNHISTFCLKHAFYGLPTFELLTFLSEVIQGYDKKDIIEIGAGSGLLGRSLGILTTDSRLQEQPYIKKLYELQGQPVIQYPEDVISMDAEDVIKKLKPKVVIASWVTQIWKNEDCEEGVSDANIYGVDENQILDNVEMYIHIGNRVVHGKKRILTYDHDEITHIPLFSRSIHSEHNVIYIWRNN